MRPNRRLALRREVLTPLGADELRGVAAGEPHTLRLTCLVNFSDCVVIQETTLCPPTEGLIGCPTTLDPPRCAGV